MRRLTVVRFPHSFGMSPLSAPQCRRYAPGLVDTLVRLDETYLRERGRDGNM